jgi:hypothetical protein
MRWRQWLRALTVLDNGRRLLASSLSALSSLLVESLAWRRFTPSLHEARGRSTEPADKNFRYALRCSRVHRRQHQRSSRRCKHQGLPAHTIHRSVPLRPSTSLPLDPFGFAYRDRTITAAIVRLVSPRSRLSLRSTRSAGCGLDRVFDKPGLAVM